MKWSPTCYVLRVAFDPYKIILLTTDSNQGQGQWEAGTGRPLEDYLSEILPVCGAFFVICGSIFGRFCMRFDT